MRGWKRIGVLSVLPFAATMAAPGRVGKGGDDQACAGGRGGLKSLPRQGLPPMDIPPVPYGDDQDDERAGHVTPATLARLGS